MNIRLRKLWNTLSSSYWFIPLLMSLGAIVLAFTLTVLDARLGDEWMEQVGWLYANQPEGARELLSTIAGSMITVAGVTFSITIAALSYATMQFGPRLLTNFMYDRGNQITLGTFIATFIYCLLVLRTIRDSGDPTGDVFVPHIAILAGVLLALASTGVLIFFVHHIPESINASNVIAGIGRSLNRQIDRLFPEPNRYDASRTSAQPAPPEDDALPISAERSGYVQHLDEERLLRLARKHDLVLQLACRPGDFVSDGQALVQAMPRSGVEADAISAIREAFVQGRQRTQVQDVLFPVNELVEIASRSLSTGMNDPFTAMICMDWLGSALINVARRNLPGGYHYDSDGELRMIQHAVSFEDFTENAFEPLRAYAQTDRNAALHMMHVIGEVMEHAATSRQRQVLLRHAERLKTGCEKHLPHPADRQAIAERFHHVAHRLHVDNDR